MENLTIGELARHCSVNPKTIRYYESIGLLPESRRASNGYRVYADADVARLAFVQNAKRLGLSLDEIRGLVPLADSRDCRSLSATLERAVSARLAWIDSQMAALEELKKSLLAFKREARARARGSRKVNDPCECANPDRRRKEVMSDVRREEGQSDERKRTERRRGM
jgi:DNA-binding transcriptional MerR regulator